MDNQHRKISGYRELSAEEIELMNRIKAKAAELLALQQEVVDHLEAQYRDASRDQFGDEYTRLQHSEPYKWADIAKTEVQMGVMMLVRAVAQPTDGT